MNLLYSLIAFVFVFFAGNIYGSMKEKETYRNLVNEKNKVLIEQKRKYNDEVNALSEQYNEAIQNLNNRSSNVSPCLSIDSVHNLNTIGKNPK